MKPAVIYHWWSEWSDASPMRNLRTPILLSIATLRANEPEIPIYVLDCGTWEHNREYEDYASRLNFTVVPWKFELLRYGNKAGFEHLSRLFDVRRFSNSIEEDTIIYCDTDVFWKASPLPLMCDPHKFCFNKHNTGYFYYKKDSIQSDRFFELFESYTITALNDDNFRYISRQYAGYNEWYYVFDEAILGYMYNKHRELFHVIDLNEHCTPSAMFPDNNAMLISPDEIRMIHANGIQVSNAVAKHEDEVGHSRGLIPLVIKEFYDSLTKVIEPEEAYTKEELDLYLPLQVEFRDPEFLRCLVESRLPNRLYDLMAALNRRHQLDR